MNLTKTLSLSATELKFNAETGTFKGYASVWDGLDSYGDTIKKGAFLDTLRDYGMPKMFYMHKWDMPVGKYTNADEDSHGFWVEGETTPNHSLASDVRAAMLHETLDGLSIGGMLAKGDFKSTDQGGRLIHKWTRLVEVSPVVFPADSAARIVDVKNVDFEALLPECKTERDIERLLRDAGLGKWEAMAIVSRAKTIFDGRDAQKDGEAKRIGEILARIQKLAA
ncbi:HK97 family phage prohead protease [Polaromonas sp. CG_9.5]|uniref:HK97 family phage prohead protease n=1 Tax=Polaromonas sp. CG_9.5 TaxID=3071705 RepID=UPI002DFD9E4E|nr:HK97 family phage prohead protease [Polaromonas sp. CG_9.5]